MKYARDGYIILVGLLPAILTPVAKAEAPEAGKAGTFTVTFADRSPLSEPKMRAVRLSEKPPPADYDLTQQQFLVVVPDTYEPGKPMGLLVLNNYKNTDSPPAPVLDLLAEKNLAFVSLKNVGQPWDTKSGLAVDAVANMQKLYKIDPTRVYLFGFDNEFSGVRLMAGYPDVFTGTYLCEFFSFWRLIQLPNQHTISGSVPIAPVKQLATARANPLVISSYTPEWAVAAVKTYHADNFRNVIAVTIAHEDVHYPNYTRPWLEKTIEFLDESRVRPKTAATHPATHPTTQPPRSPSRTLVH